MSASLTEHLVTVNEPALATLLNQRPDALRGGEPRDLTELSDRLNHPASLLAALSRLPLPCLQLAEALAALAPLGTGATRAKLRDLLDDADCSARGHEADVDDILSLLYAVAVAWPGERDRIRVPDALGSMFGAPLRLGQPLGHLLLMLNVDEMRGIQGALGLEHGRDKAEVTASLRHHLGQPDVIRAIVAKAPPAVRTELVRRARGNDPGRGTNHVEATRWAAERGMMIGSHWGNNWSMPAEVALALRGADYRAPFESQARATPTVEVSPDSVESESAVAATAFADHTLAILDRVHRSPLASLKFGGVGVRELTRLAKTVACSEVDARLSLELAHAGGLLETRDEGVSTSEQFARWRAQDPGIRLAVLLAAWWRMGRSPSDARDDEDKSIPALSPRADCAGCREARVALLAETSRLPSTEAADRASVAAALQWRRPLLHGSPQDGSMSFATLWREAELLGLLGHNAISRLGRAVLAGNEDAIEAQAAALLPHSSDQASFGTDLTAVVVGAPSARVSSLLDSCADREGRGGATIWRLSPASVRRVLDDGTTGPELEQLLSSIATTELPQPLGYLIADVARRHGLLRISPAVSVIRSGDTALLAEVAVDRKLKRLGLRLLAPTLLACDVPVEEALAAMRTAGYFPLPEGTDDAAPTGANGIPADGGAAQAREGSEIAPDVATRLWADDRLLNPASEPADPASVAARLVGKGQRSLRVAPSGTEAELGRLNRQLPNGQARQLAHAIDHGQNAVIDYVATGGGRTIREISDIQLIGDSLYAVCDPRQEDRVFTVSRIQSVSLAL